MGGPLSRRPALSRPALTCHMDRPFGAHSTGKRRDGTRIRIEEGSPTGTRAQTTPPRGGHRDAPTGRPPQQGDPAAGRGRGTVRLDPPAPADRPARAHRADSRPCRDPGKRAQAPPRPLPRRRDEDSSHACGAGGGPPPPVIGDGLGRVIDPEARPQGRIEVAFPRTRSPRRRCPGQGDGHRPRLRQRDDGAATGRQDRRARAGSPVHPECRRRRPPGRHDGRPAGGAVESRGRGEPQLARLA